MKSKANNSRVYFMEAAGLGGFVAIAGLVTIFMEHPELPPMQSAFGNHPLLRRLPLGIIMGAYIALVTIWAGKKSGAHINPAVTWSFYYLKKIRFKDAVLYTLAQFGGAILAAQILKHTVGYWFSHSTINYGSTAPKPQYTSPTAFAAEFVISFILLFVVLLASGSKQWEKRLPLLSALLIASFIIFELPFSGMSMNPARSAAGDLAAMKFEHLWIYFVSPVAAMLLAVFLFKKIHNQYNEADKKQIPDYPMENG